MCGGAASRPARVRVRARQQYALRECVCPGCTDLDYASTVDKARTRTPPLYLSLLAEMSCLAVAVGLLGIQLQLYSRQTHSKTAADVFVAYTNVGTPP